MKVLIADSSESFGNLISQVLKKHAAEPFVVKSASEVLNCLYEEHFELVCMSKHLPDLEAASLIQKVKKINRTVNTQFVLMTSDYSQDLRDRETALGFTDIINKRDIAAIENQIKHIIDNIKSKLSGRVLYIEDSVSVAQFTMSCLNELGLTITHFTNAEDALIELENSDYELIITDVVLEHGISGLELIHEVRKVSGNKGLIPILALSGSTIKKQQVELLQAGANDYVNKPLQTEEFLARVRNLILTQQLINQISRQQEQLYKMAMIDELTSLYNRRSLNEFAPKYLSEAQRHKYHLTVLVIDLDHFKQVNDKHGHSTGDVVLSETGKLINGSCRKGDLAARFGGEEFVLLLTHCTLDQGSKYANKLLNKIRKLQPAGLDITCSIGVSSTEQDNKANFEKLFNCADEAVYQAKSGGRNQVVVYSDEKS